jgi:4-amino-4-deoxy-L-arabinose transferase-like glycosyltransferase
VQQAIPPPRQVGQSLGFGCAIVALAFLLRLADASLSSFHLDDFHSLHHARASSLGSFFDVLTQDNHPPLSFFVLRVLRSILGEGEFVLRLPNVIYGTLSVALAWRIGRRLPNREMRILGTALFALSSLHLDLSSDLRMYALLGMCVLGVLDASLDVLQPLESGAGGSRSGLRLAAWTAAALLSHYHSMHALAIIVVVILSLVVSGNLLAARVRSATIWALVGVLFVSPWYATGFRAQLGHDLAPGSSSVSVAILGESFVHLIFVRLDLLGSLRPVLLGLGLLTFPLACFGLLRLLQGARRTVSGWALPALLAGLAFLLPLWTAAMAWLQPRAGFEWRYLVAAIAPYCLLVGAAAGSGPLLKLRRSLLVVCLTGATALSLAHVMDAGREDYRAATLHLLEKAQPGDGVLGVEWSPRLFPRGIGWSYYAEQLGDGRELGLVSLDHTADFQLLGSERLSDLPRVHCLLRSVDNDVPLLNELRAFYPVEEKARFGEAIWVLSFSGE